MSNSKIASLPQEDLVKKIAELHGFVYVLLEEIISLRCKLHNEDISVVTKQLQKEIETKGSVYLNSLIK